MYLLSLSSIPSNQSSYDFSNMNSKQAITAAGNLASNGTITGDQFAVLAGDTTALSSVPVNGNQAGGTDPLDSTSSSDYFKVLKDSIEYMKGLGSKDESETNGLNTSESLLAALNRYQYGTIDGSQMSGTSLSTLA